VPRVLAVGGLVTAIAAMFLARGATR
jgi:hypothetical protein